MNISACLCQMVEFNDTIVVFSGVQRPSIVFLKPPEPEDMPEMFTSKFQLDQINLASSQENKRRCWWITFDTINVAYSALRGKDVLDTICVVFDQDNTMVFRNEEVVQLEHATEHHHALFEYIRFRFQEASCEEELPCVFYAMDYCKTADLPATRADAELAIVGLMLNPEFWTTHGTIGTINGD